MVTRHAIHMMTALMWAERSKCKRLRVGAVITSVDQTRILAVGYNGPARGLSNYQCSEMVGGCGCLHAEENALIRSGYSDGPRTLFTTHLPCVMCAQRCINGGITAIYYLSTYRDNTALGILEKVKVPCLPIDPKDLSALWSQLTAKLPD